jgi:hypothetical protein
MVLPDKLLPLSCIAVVYRTSQLVAHAGEELGLVTD